MGQFESCCSSLPHRVVRQLQEGIKCGFKGGEMNLESMNINDDMIPELCEWIEDLGGRLTSTNLKNNEITSAGALLLFKALKGKNNFVCKILLNNNNIDDACMSSLGELLQRDKKITHLNLSGNNLTDRGVKTLSISLMKGTGLTHLRLSHNVGITDASVDTLFNIVEFSKVYVLKVHGTSISHEGLFSKHFIQGIKTGKLTEIVMSGKNWRDDILIRVCNLFEKFQCKHLRFVDLTNNQLTSYGIVVLATLLNSGSDIQTLWLGRNQIDDSCMIEIGELVKNKSTLIDISLAETHITDEGIHILSKYFDKRRLLQRLNISRNLGISDLSHRDIEFMVRNSLISCFPLTNRFLDFERNLLSSLVLNALDDKGSGVLSLSNQNIGDSGIGVIRDTIKQKPITRLRKVDLSGNGITSEGAVFLFNALRDIRTIQLVDLSQNKLNDRCMFDFAEFLKENKDIQSVNLSQNEITDEGIYTLASNARGATLQSLYISCNLLITNKSLPFWEDIARTTMIKNIYLAQTSISASEMDKIQKQFSLPIEMREIPIQSNSKSAAKSLR